MFKTYRSILGTGAVLMALALALGAFGAHGLEVFLAENGRTATFETAVKYHFYHALGIIMMGVLSKMEMKGVHISASLLFSGILIFSGSLYILCLSGIGILGAITPIGGLLLIAGWIHFAWIAIKAKV
jgi:uncharacterized membrane protein YgdD (TMEM256/DUF423 family)